MYGSRLSDRDNLLLFVYCSGFVGVDMVKLHKNQPNNSTLSALKKN